MVTGLATGSKINEPAIAKQSDVTAGYVFIEGLLVKCLNYFP